MNQLVNIIFLFFALLKILPMISDYTSEPMFRKLLLVVVVLGLEFVFDAILKIIKRDKLSITSMLDKSLMNSLLILLGFLLFNDLKESPSIMSKVPGLDKIIDLETTKIIIYILPIILFTTSKCFLKAY